MNDRVKLVPKILRDHITEKQWRGTTLDLACKNLGDLSARALASWSGIHLNLYCNHICDEGAKALVKWKGLTLDLSNNHIGEEGAKALISHWRGANLNLCDEECHDFTYCNNLDDEYYQTQYMEERLNKSLKHCFKV